ncbi:hypothetical protein C5167_025621 [Papaver somniferum]|uniref:Uncharacterized protein n=1 Tax=Papaver somniferum TaxID=3469 RepID=A0A4Y7JVK8_PAPSO|nr:hypothetical protein C5167_025621 [Papaver somniferum]
MGIMSFYIIVATLCIILLGFIPSLPSALHPVGRDSVALSFSLKCKTEAHDLAPRRRRYKAACSTATLG